MRKDQKHVSIAINKDLFDKVTSLLKDNKIHDQKPCNLTALIHELLSDYIQLPKLVCIDIQKTELSHSVQSLSEEKKLMIQLNLL